MREEGEGAGQKVEKVRDGKFSIARARGSGERREGLSSSPLSTRTWGEEEEEALPYARRCAWREEEEEIGGERRRRRRKRGERERERVRERERSQKRGREGESLPHFFFSIILFF